VVVAIAILIVVLVGIWVSHHWKGWVSDFGSSTVKQMIDTSELDPQQKVAINAQVDRVADAFSSGRMSLEQMHTLMERILKSPWMASVITRAAEKKYLARSGLSDAEKAAATITIRRFISGAIEKKIDKAGIDAAMAHIADVGPNDQIQLRETVSDKDLRAFLDEAKAQADKAVIPDQPPTFDAAAEFKKIVDESMDENQAEAPPDAAK
jgi:hypothetical protein